MAITREEAIDGDYKKDEWRPTVGQQLALISDETIVSIYHVNVAYIYYGPVKDAPYPVKSYYEVLLIDPDGSQADGENRMHIMCEKIDTKKKVVEEVKVHEEDLVQITTFI